MIRQNLHMHSRFDDGKAGCREMLLSCADAGMTSAGVSLHSPMPFANDWAPETDIPFLAEMEKLKGELADRITVYTGIEMDLLSFGNVDPAPFDYVIGSVHHLPLAEIPPAVDDCPGATADTLRRFFGGDADAMAEAYFEQVCLLAEKKEFQICGHFDLLTKFDEKHGFFRPESARYRAAAGRALDAMLDTDRIFEVNTGAISRGWRTSPYPSRELLLRIAARHGRVTVSSDAHAADAVNTGFAEAECLLLACGFREIWQLFPGSGSPEFRPVPLGD